MRPISLVIGGLLWIVGSVLAVLALVLCITVILLPLGIPLLMLARRIVGLGVKLVTPRAVSHPIDEGSKSVRKVSGKTRANVRDIGERASDQLPSKRRLRKRLRKKRRRLSKTLSG